jgi:predicted TIM-barrel fold metal-dependent hydrolase
MYTGEIIDCDIHHARGSDEEFVTYLSKGWREYVADRGPAGLVPLTVQDGLPNPHGFMRADTYPENGGAPGSDYETLRCQLLERSNIRRAILTFGDDSHVSGHHNPYFATELARALNDWTIERWLPKDARLASSILVACQLPDRAAAEIRRHADNHRMVQVMLVDNPYNYGFGHPVFHPIYEAAEETGRPIAIHGGAGGWANPASTGGGNVTLYFEAHTLWPQAMMTHLVSFISHGVFDKHPKLRLLLIEGGAAWLPSLMWRCDCDYKGLRREVPWLRRLPSEYVAEHVWLTTQPLEISPRREQIVELLGWMNGADRLVYSSDYPHWDADEVNHISAQLPQSWHRKVFFENAMKLYGWSEAELPAPQMVSA